MNLRWGKTACKWRRAKITRGKNNPVFSNTCLHSQSSLLIACDKNLHWLIWSFNVQSQVIWISYENFSFMKLTWIQILNARFHSHIKFYDMHISNTAFHLNSQTFISIKKVIYSYEISHNNMQQNCLCIQCWVILCDNHL